MSGDAGNGIVDFDDTNSAILFLYLLSFWQCDSRSGAIGNREEES